MTIRILHHTVRYQKIGIVSEDNPTGYQTVPGELSFTCTGRPERTRETLLDGMLLAQEDFGQITWNGLAANIARGSYYNTEHGGHNRVVVIDTDNADGSDIIDAVVWVHAAGED